MPACLDKNQVEKVKKRQASLLVIKNTVEEMGGTCKINWQTETVSIDGPLPEMAYAAAVEAALSNIGAREKYDMGEGDNLFIDEIEN